MPTAATGGSSCRAARIFAPAWSSSAGWTITESTTDLLPTLPVVFMQRLPARNAAGAALGLPIDENFGPATSQFREPSAMARGYLKSYARHVAHAYPSPQDPDLPITGIKIYRVTHNMLPAQELHQGRDPLDPSLYEAYFLGEYEADGTLKASDGFRWWRIPIRWVPLEEVHTYPNRYPIVKDAEIRLFKMEDGPRKVEIPQVLLDGVRVHGGDPLEPHPEALKYDAKKDHYSK